MTEVQIIDAKNEAELLWKVGQQHPNIVQCHEVFYANSNLNIIMEYCSNKDLDHYIQEYEGYILEETIWRLFIQICLGIKVIHDNKIIHRDIKPANIFMNVEDGEVVPKIGDFGIGKALTNTNSMAQTKMLGTLNYMSPEIWKGQDYN